MLIRNSHVNKKLIPLVDGVDGLEVNEIPPEQISTEPLLTTVYEPEVTRVAGEAKYQFIQSYTRRVKGHKLLYHIVLPSL